jgi:hypothetical protein
VLCMTSEISYDKPKQEAYYGIDHSKGHPDRSYTRDRGI